MPDATTTWSAMKRRHEECLADRRVGIAPETRQPAAAVLACSDARVPPTVLFGHPGELFVVRIAGNSATPDAVASLTYAVEHLGTELVVVLGHTGCGAVQAALGGEAPEELAPIVEPISEMLADCTSCTGVDAAVIANVRHSRRRLRRDGGPLGRAIRDGRVAVRGAVHDLRTGALIEVDDERPDGDHPDHLPSDHLPTNTMSARSTR